MKSIAGIEYPKIETYFNRDQKTFKVTDEIRCPEFELINKWILTEKIDGTNIRVIFRTRWRDEMLIADSPKYREVIFMGRTAKAQIPKHLLEYLRETFTVEKLEAAFPDLDADVVLFGEGYGYKIQHGGKYRQDSVSFRLFDVFIEDEKNPLGGWWIERLNMQDIARKLEIKTVKVIGMFNTQDAIDYCKRHPLSFVAWEDSGQDYAMEGIVARTEPTIFNRKGKRIIWKLKVSDFE